MDLNAYVSSVDLELARLGMHLQASLSRLAWGLSRVPGHEFLPVYVREDPQGFTADGFTWRRQDNLSYA